MGELERLGETAEFGSFLLQVLSMRRPDGRPGWTVTITAAFGGGVMVIARRGALEVCRTGISSAHVAPEVFEEAMRLEGHWLKAA